MKQSKIKKALAETKREITNLNLPSLVRLFDLVEEAEAKNNQREKDIQELCKQIFEMGITNTGDYRGGGACPICGADCCWDDSISDIGHKPDCAYLIAKDLTTK